MDLQCPTGAKCPEGTSSTSNNPEFNRCTHDQIPGLNNQYNSFNSLDRFFPDYFSNDIDDTNRLISARASGISAGCEGYNSSGYPSGGRDKVCRVAQTGKLILKPKKPEYTLPGSLTQFTWNHEPDSIMVGVLNETNTFFKKPSNWDGGSYPLTYDANRDIYFEKYDGKWYSTTSKCVGWNHEPDSIMVGVLNETNTFFKKPSNWDGGSYPLTYDANRGMYFAKENGKWYSKK